MAHTITEPGGGTSMSVTIRDWDPYKTYADGKTLGTLGKEFGMYSSKFTLLAAMLDADDKAVTTFEEASKFVPMGLVQNFGLNQQKQIQQLYEIGSDLEVTTPGRTFRSFSMSRALIRGGSLLYILKQGLDDTLMAEAASGQIALNLAARIFDNPLGLAMLFYRPFTEDTGSAAQELAAAFALDRCWIQAHSMSSTAGDVVMLENITLTVTKITPIEISNIQYS